MAALQWNKSMFYGDWLYDHKGMRQFYIEIQVKRISGADDALLEKCGIHTKYAWLSLMDGQPPAVQPVVLPSLARMPGPAMASRSRSSPGESASGSVGKAEGDESAVPAHAAAAPSTEVPASSVDKGKGKEIAEDAAAHDAHTSSTSSGPGSDRQEAAAASASAGQSSQQRAPLPNISTLALDSATPGPATAAAGSSDGAPRTGIPRSRPLPCTGSFDSLDQPSKSELSSDSTDESFEESEGEEDDDEDEGSVYLAEGADPFASIPSAHDTPAVSAADLHAHREAFDRSFKDKCEELERLVAFQDEPAAAARKRGSFMYAVRLVAIPDRGHVTNVFTGPPAADRTGTLLAQGGWVVPPLAERAAWRDQHQRAYRDRGARPGRYEGVPRPRVDCAVPVAFDWSGDQQPRYFGQPAPLWREPAEPCLEDVYWMVWQLLAGVQYLGFRPGTGFGVSRTDTAGNAAMLADCPFKSPSPEALYHAASYPRGDETKKN